MDVRVPGSGLAEQDALAGTVDPQLSQCSIAAGHLPRGGPHRPAG